LLLAEQQGEVEAAISEAEDFVTKHLSAAADEYADKTKALKTLAQPLVDAIRDLLAAKAATAAEAENNGGKDSEGSQEPEEPLDDEL
jgi:hypothetical protein